jgi:hypothetical protein
VSLLAQGQDAVLKRLDAWQMAADLALSARRDRSVHETGMHDIQWNRNTQSDGRPTATLRMEAKVTGLPVLAHLG